MSCNYEINLKRNAHDSKSVELDELHVNMYKIKTRLEKKQFKIK